eukprot:GEMP01061381.1.p1 GENE.GEMP01061381.1~~GEMP01061381.1.p1  ORF type:complete len:247 (+),score=58.90 GEMP01061381.1:28-741(+)
MMGALDSFMKHADATEEWVACARDALNGGPFQTPLMLKVPSGRSFVPPVMIDMSASTTARLSSRQPMKFKTMQEEVHCRMAGRIARTWRLHRTRRHKRHVARALHLGRALERVSSTRWRGVWSKLVSFARERRKTALRKAQQVARTRRLMELLSAARRPLLLICFDEWRRHATSRRTLRAALTALNQSLTRGDGRGEKRAELWAWFPLEGTLKVAHEFHREWVLRQTWAQWLRWCVE